MRIGARTIPTTTVSTIPRNEFLSCSIGRVSAKYFWMFRSRSFSSDVSLLTASMARSSISPNGPFCLAFMGRIVPNFPSLFGSVFDSAARASSARTISSTLSSNSPNGPGTSIGRTIPSRNRLCCARVNSDCKISRIAADARRSASPNGPRRSSSMFLGRTTFNRDRSRSDTRICSKKSTTRCSSDANGPGDTPASFAASIGRTRIPPNLTISFAR
mmetsp:Transcript_3336/g.7854  ORF Transcript_3336/g.7854 Transcript_3336/m.7854 type:complete len:216 (-) Transcript_3336:685-1332(-)